MTDTEKTGFDEEKEFRKLRNANYADILFIMLPFLAIFMQRLWAGEIDKMMKGPELSTAATVLAGLSVCKFIQGLVSEKEFGVYKERVVLAIAITLFLVLVPSVILTMKLSSGEQVPGVIAYVQPLLLVVAISLYYSAVRIIRAEEPTDEEENVYDETDDAFFEGDADAFPVDALAKSEPKAKT